MNKKVNSLEAYEQLAEAYDRMIEIKPHNAFYDRPNTLSLLPDVNGKRVLDAGCGPGKYAEILLERGAHVTGIDLSTKMIEKAILRNENRGRFFVHDLTTVLPFENSEFDLVISPLVLDYIYDWRFVFSEFYRVLNTNGVFVFSVSHPFFDYGYYKSDNYFENEKVSATWKGFGKPVEVQTFRRSLSECISPLLQSGFKLDTLLEPLPNSDFKKCDLETYEKLMRFPSFLCIRASKG